METEIEAGLSEAEALEEAKRCMSCGMCMDCETCWMYCTNSCFVKLPKGEHYRVKLEVCNGCKKCADACPCGYIEMMLALRSGGFTPPWRGKPAATTGQVPP